MNCEVCGDIGSCISCVHCQFKFCKSCFKFYISTQPKELSLKCPNCKRPMHIIKRKPLEMIGLETINKLKGMEDDYRKPFDEIIKQYSAEDIKRFQSLNKLSKVIDCRLMTDTNDVESHYHERIIKNLIKFIKLDLPVDIKYYIQTEVFITTPDELLYDLIDVIDEKLKDINVKYLKYKREKFEEFAVDNYCHKHNSTKVSSYPLIVCNCKCGGLVLKPDYKCNICGSIHCHECFQEDHEGECDNVFIEFNKDAKPCPICGRLYKHDGGCDHMLCTNCRTQYKFSNGEIIIGRMVDLKPTDQLGKTMFDLKAQECSLTDVDPDEMKYIMIEAVEEKHPLFKYLYFNGEKSLQAIRKILLELYIAKADPLAIGIIVELLHITKRLYHRIEELLSFLYFQDVKRSTADHYMAFILNEKYEFCKSIEKYDCSVELDFTFIDKYKKKYKQTKYFNEE